MRVLYCTDTYPPQINGVSIVTELSVAGLTRRGLGLRRGGAALSGGSPTPSGAADPEAGAGGAGHEPAERGDAAATPTSGSPSRAGRRCGSVMAAVPARPGALRDGVLDRAHGPARGGGGRRAGGLLVPHRLRALRRGVRDTLAAADRHGLPDAVPPPEPAGVHPVGGGEGRARDARRRARWRSGDEGSTRRPSIRDRRSQELRDRLGMGSRFTFVYVGRLAPEKRVDVVMEAFRQAAALVPRGVIHLIIAGTGPCEADAPGVGTGRRHLPRLPRPSRRSCPISTPTATRSCSRR